MLKKVKEISGKDLLALITIINKQIKTEADFKFPTLFNHIMNNNDLNKKYINKTGKLDIIMFKAYLKIQALKDRIKEDEENNEVAKGFGIDDLLINVSKSKKLLNVFYSLLYNTKFEYANIRQVQKYELQKELLRCIDKEDYERCSEIKKDIENC